MALRRSLKESEGESKFSRQGSLRKVFHSPNNDGSGMLGVPAKLVELSTSDNPVAQSYSVYFQEYRLIAEFNKVLDRFIPGLYVAPSGTSPFLWYGVLFVKSGLYQGGIFRFSLHIPEMFPETTDCPKIIFESQVFHPCIEPKTLELNVKKEFSVWKNGTHHLWQVLEYTRDIFYEFSNKPATNVEASQLYFNDMEEFSRRVTVCCESSIAEVSSLPFSSLPDPNYIRFSPFTESLHGPLLKKLKSPPQSPGVDVNGFSWVQPGSLQPFSKPSS